MTQTTIYHNPRCSKSRQTLAILEAHNLDVDIVKYLENPLSTKIIKELLAELKLGIRDILRTGENDYKAQDFKNQSLTDDELILKLSLFPKVMQRPIVSHQGHAVIGRPPENVLALIA